MIYSVTVVPVRGAANWAVRAEFRGKRRYRAFYSKREAIRDMDEWDDWEDAFFKREFDHNFLSAEESGIREYES